MLAHECQEEEIMLFANRRTRVVSTSHHDQKSGEPVINHIFSIKFCWLARVLSIDHTGKGLQEGRQGGSWTNAHFLPVY